MSNQSQNEQSNPAEQLPVLAHEAAGVLRDDGVAVAPASMASAGHAAGGASAPAAAGNAEMLRFAHWALRGRYTVAVILGLTVGIACAVAAWKLERPQYESSGLIRIAYTLPRVMQATDQNEPMLMYEAFMNSQRLLITSRRVIDTAIQDPIWKATNRAVPADPDRYFAENLKVEVKPRSEFISITVSDPDPGTAATAVTSIINAYSELYNSQNKTLDRQRIGVLQDRQTELQGQIDSLSAAVTTAGQEYGTTDLEMFYVQAVARVSKLEAALSDLRAAIATAGWVPASQPADGPKVEEPAAPLTVAQISAVDPVMRNYVDEETKLIQQLDGLVARGLGENHGQVTMTKRLLETARMRVTQYAETYRTFHVATGRNISDARGAVETAGKSLETLKENEVSLAKLLKDTKQEMITIGGKQLAMRRQDEQLKQLREEMAKLTQRMEVLRAEGLLGGRLSVINSGEIPLSPSLDRRIKLAAAAGGLGALVPAMAIILVSFVRRRYRYSDEAAADGGPRQTPLLGMMPQLPATGADGEQMFTAAHCVHQIRISLLAQARLSGARTYLVTSATAGEGKTSLALSLGLSFTAARLRTLVIDGDLVGRRLTSEFEAGGSAELREALAAGKMNGYVRKTTAGMCLLPAGKAGINDAAAMSASAMRAILDEAKANFDVVLVDSGPILGSVEAAVAAQEVDGVIFTITRGQDKTLVQTAIQRLRSLGVDDLGLVFNRAKRADLARSAYGSSRSTISNPNQILKLTEDPDIATKAEKLSRFGPLVQAVALGMPAMRQAS